RLGKRSAARKGSLQGLLDEVEEAGLEHAGSGVQRRLVGIALGGEVDEHFGVVGVDLVRKERFVGNVERFYVFRNPVQPVLHRANPCQGLEELGFAVVDLGDAGVLDVRLIPGAEVVAKVDERLKHVQAG